MDCNLKLYNNHTDKQRLDAFQEAEETNNDLLKFPDQLHCLKESVE